jgi:hypothetical protein
MGLFDKQTNRSHKGLFPSTGSDPYSLDNVNNQISNASTRISDAGYTPENSDGRNWFEKATNLPQNQNGFLDTLELLGRPGNAVKNFISKSVIGDSLDPTDSLYRGFTGKDKVSGAELAGQMGLKTGAGKFVVGLGLDLGLDPTTYIPGGVIAKGIGSVAKPIGGIAKGAYGLAESASPTLKAFREGTIQPAFNSAKDALGHAFVPQYKWDQTLSGGTDNTLNDLYRTTNNNMNFMNENSMQNIGNIAKTTGIDAGTDVGRLMEQDVPLYGPRANRSLSTDPAQLQATQNLIDSNTQLREWAVSNDIPIGEIDGYMRHILSQEERALRKAKPSAVDYSPSNMNNPDKKVLNERTLQGSVEDVNDMVGRKLFEPNAYFATAIGQKKLIDYGNAVKFRREILSNPDFAEKFVDGMHVADHHELIDTNNYSFMKNGANSLPDEIGGKYVVTKGVKESLDRYQGLATDEGTKGMLKAFDGLQNTWKKMALFSPGFHIRNVAGAMFNNTVAGMNPIQLVKYTKDAGSEVINAMKGNESALFKEYRAQGLSSSGISKVEFAKTGEDPEKAIQRTIENMSKTGKDNVIGKLKSPFQTSQEIGDSVDQVNRFALYKWAREAKGMSAEDAAKKVKEVQYDYKDLTPFERNVMKRAIPFYTWSRKNIPFQLKSFINDQRPYEAINKVRLNAQSAAGLDDKNTPDFMKNNFAIPLTHSKMLGLNLPLGDLTKLTSPLKLLTDGLSPIIKTPLEESLNYNFFKGKPIEKFAGQDKKYLGGLAIPAKLDYAIQAATGQIGKGLSTAFGDTGNVDQSNKFKAPSLGMSVVKPYDAEKSIYYQKVDELKKLQDFLQYIQQQTGAKPRTIAEIKKSLKN